MEYESRRLKVTVTGYCPCRICCGDFADGKTATGRDARKSGIAVDPEIISLGSYIDVPGYNRGPNNNGSWIMADDTGRVIKGNKIDLRFQTHGEAKKWGKKEMIVRVWTRIA